MDGHMADKMKQKILVTGGTGYIGSHTVVDLMENGFEVISVDNGINSDFSVLEGIYRITGSKVLNYPLDLCDPDTCKTIFSEHSDIAGIIHFAALKAVGESVQKPALYFKNNLLSLIHMLEYAVMHKVGAFIFSSSCTVYGEPDHMPVNEETPLREAESPYGRTKQMGEQIVKDILAHTNVKSTLLRYFNPAGAHPSAYIGESPLNTAQNLVPVITETAIGKRVKMRVFGNDYPTRDGSCIRDYIHVCDLAHAHTLALEYILSGRQHTSCEVFNLGIGQGLTVLEVIQAFEKVTGRHLNYEIGPRRPGDVMAIYSDYKKAAEVLNWKPKYGVDDIMHTAWEWEKRRSAGV